MFELHSMNIMALLEIGYMGIISIYIDVTVDKFISFCSRIGISLSGRRLEPTVTSLLYCFNCMVFYMLSRCTSLGFSACP